MAIFSYVNPTASTLYSSFVRVSLDLNHFQIGLDFPLCLILALCTTIFLRSKWNATLMNLLASLDSRKGDKTESNGTLSLSLSLSLSR